MHRKRVSRLWPLSTWNKTTPCVLVITCKVHLVVANVICIACFVHILLCSGAGHNGEQFGATEEENHLLMG